MRIKVQSETGVTETITLVPPVQVVLGNQLNRLIDGSGMEHWFTDEGYYDGWGMSLPGVSQAQANEIISRVENDRDIEPER